MFREPSGFKYG